MTRGTRESGRRHFPYRQGGKAIPHAPREELPERAPGKSWTRQNEGQGGEGLSQGYGGAAGKGTGPSGPENDHAPHDRSNRSKARQK
jgi:hypothetical protein